MGEGEGRTRSSLLLLWVTSVFTARSSIGITGITKDAGMDLQEQGDVLGALSTPRW